MNEIKEKIMKADTTDDMATEVRVEIRAVAGGYILTEMVAKGHSQYLQSTREQIFVQPRKLLKHVADFLETHKSVVEG